MKWIASFVLFLTTQAFAHSPQIHFCNITSGVFQTIEVAGDQVGFCQYGTALIDAITVLETTTGLQRSQASNQAMGSGSSCGDAGGTVLAGQTLEGLQFSICQFSDGSSIEVSTLEKGSLSADNAAMIHALNQRF